MTFDASSAAIVFLAWERGLGLPEHSLLAGPGRVVHATAAGSLTYLRLWDRSVVTGPEHLLEAIRHMSDDELSRPATLLQLAKHDGGRGLSTQTLYYADDLALHQPADTVHVSTAPEQADQLQAECPPDDVNDAALLQRSTLFTVMDSEEATAQPLACSGWSEYQGLLAPLGTLVAPPYRRQGLGILATSIAAHEALAAGLIVQWGADTNNAGAHAVAASLGLSVAGLQTQVSLQTDQSRRK